MTDNFDKDIGFWLETKRNNKGYSLQYVADQMGVTRTAVHCWEKGKRSLYAQTLLDYCKVLDADLEEFINPRKKTTVPTQRSFPGKKPTD